MIALGLALAAAPGLAQNAGPAPPGPPAPAQSERLPVYKPPLRGAAGGRVGGATRSAAIPAGALPVVELLAPADHAGLSARPDPTLYFYLSRPTSWPMQFTISAPMQPRPVLEAAIPTPTAGGIYPLPTAAYHVRLQPGVAYTWSVSIVIDPRAWSHNLVASATIVVAPISAPSPQDATALAQAGLWYDAVAAAVEAQDRDRHRALDALLRQVGLADVAAYEQRADAR